MNATRTILLAALVLAPAAAQQAGNLAEAPEPNHTIWSASVLLCGRQALGNIGFGGADTDSWCFTLSHDHEVLVTASPRSPYATFSLALYDATGVVLAGVDRDDASRLRVNLTSGTYCVTVVGGRVVDGTFRMGAGDYALDLTCYPVTSARCATFSSASESEPNDTIQDARPTACCTRITGRLEQFDTDSFRLDVVTPQVLFAEIAYTMDPGTAASAALWAADGTTFLEEFARRTDRTTFTLQRLLAPGTYYVRGSLGFFFPLDYTLEIDCRPITAPFEVAAQRTFGTGCTGIAGNAPHIVTMPDELPLVGSTYSVFFADTDDGGGANYVWALLGVDALDPGLDLSVIGAPGCALYVQPLLDVQLTNEIYLPPRTPVLSLEWYIVNEPTVVGRECTVQGVVWEPPELLTTDALTATVGNWLPEL